VANLLPRKSHQGSQTPLVAAVVKRQSPNRQKRTKRRRRKLLLPVRQKKRPKPRLRKQKKRLLQSNSRLRKRLVKRNNWKSNVLLWNVKRRQQRWMSKRYVAKNSTCAVEA